MPSAITDLRITASGADSVTLAWTSPVVNSAGGDHYYSVRCSSEVLTAGSFLSLPDVDDITAPGSPGSTEVLAVTGLVHGVTYRFAVTTTDDDGESLLSNVPLATLTDLVYRRITPGEAQLAPLWGARHRFIVLRESGVTTPGVITPSAGKRIIINSCSVQTSNNGVTVVASSPGVESCSVSARITGGLASRYWQGWPWMVGLRGQPITFDTVSTPTWLYVSVGYFEA